MKYFIDTEFIERGPEFPITLISIGIVADNGSTLYLVSSDFNENDCNDWVKANVLPHLGDYPRGHLWSIAEGIREWIEIQSGDSKPEFWGYYCDYDWVVFCQMFGTMMDLPSGWPMYCRDLKQLCDDRGNPELPRQESTEHNALADALWNLQVYKFLTEAL